MAGGDGKDKKVEQTEYKFATKPVEKTGWEGFITFVWNSETSQFLGRTGMSWCKSIFNPPFPHHPSFTAKIMLWHFIKIKPAAE